MPVLLASISPPIGSVDIFLWRAIIDFLGLNASHFGAIWLIMAYRLRITICSTPTRGQKVANLNVGFTVTRPLDYSKLLEAQ